VTLETGPWRPESEAHPIKAVILSDRSEAKGVEGSAFLDAGTPRAIKKNVFNLGLTTPKACGENQVLKGHAFSRAEEARKKRWASAPAEGLDTEGGGGFNPRIKPTESARALAPEG
jgi:hypothetical protein